MHNKLKIKKGDTVKVISGKDKGKTGKVLEVMPRLSRVVVENVNVHTRFERSKQAGQPGKKVTFSAPMPASKVMLVDPSSGHATRVGFRRLDDGSKQRIARSSGKSV